MGSRYNCGSNVEGFDVGGCGSAVDQFFESTTHVENSKYKSLHRGLKRLTQIVLLCQTIIRILTFNRLD